MKCLIEECIGSPKVRGLCPSHYIALTKAVRAGRTTWQMLEQFGMAVPSKMAKRNLAEKQLQKSLNRLQKHENPNT